MMRRMTDMCMASSMIARLQWFVCMTATALVFSLLVAPGGAFASESGGYAQQASAQGQKIVDSVQINKSLAEKLPEEYNDSIKVGMTFRFPPMRWRDD